MVKKRTKKKKVVRKTAKKINKKPKPSKARKMVRSTKNKINLAFKNLILFLILLVISLVLYHACEGMYSDLFFLLAMIFGFVSLAFFISLLVFLLLKAAKK